AAIALDRTGRVVLTNEPARLLFGDGLALIQDRLVASGPDIAAKLAALIAQAVAPHRANDPALNHVAVPRPSGKRPYRLTTHPLGPNAQGTFDRIVALILISDPEQRRIPAIEAMRRQFGLTIAETR